MKERIKPKLYLKSLLRTSALISVLIVLSAFAYAVTSQNDMDIVALCKDMERLADSQDYIEKQMEWQDAQQKVETLGVAALNSSPSAWKAYYIQLYRMLIYVDPSKSMAVQRPYMQAMDELIHKLPKEHRLLKWFATKKLSRLYNLDNNQQKAFALLEETVLDILKKEHHDARDSICLTQSMERQLYCYNVLPPDLGARNMHFLSKYASTPIAPLGLALYRKDYNEVVRICEARLDDKKVKLLDIYYIFILLEDALAHIPASDEHAASMSRLLEKQKKMHQEINQRLSFDYQKYQELQEESRVEAELQQQRHKQFIQSASKICLLGLLIVLLMVIVWIMFYRSSKFRGQILRKVRREQDDRKATLVETQRAYASQVQLIRNLNHDIRVPLNALIGFSHILSSEEKITPETQQEAGDSIRQTSQQLLYIINNLLSIARLERNKMVVHVDRVPASQLVDSGLWEGFATKLQPAHSLAFQPATSDLLIETDLALVRHIMELTIADIVRQMSSGTISVACRMDNNTQRICISTQASSRDLALDFMREALNIEKSMSDYDDANSYYLVLARMMAQLIGGELLLEVDAETAYLELWLPVRNNIQSTKS